MPEHSRNEDESLTAEGQLFSYICSDTGRAYDLTEYVNDTNREYTEVLTDYTVNSGATESYSYAGTMRNSRNDIWTEARDVVQNEMSYYLYDGRGSVTANTWYNGRVTDVYQYDPYGQVTLGSTEHTDFYGYNAESYNPNTGLEFLRARYYNANQGRFFQEDTYLGDITDPLTLNRYAYVKNSPLNYVDPSGHDPRDEFDSPSNYLPNEGDIEFLGPELYEKFVYLYNTVAKTTDQKWELIDHLNKLRYGGTGSKLKNAVSFIMDNPQYVLGAVGAAAIYIGVTVATGGTAGIAAAPLIFSGNVLTLSGISGAVTGITYNEYTKNEIRQQLKQEYGVDIKETQLYAMDKLPDKAIALCEEYEDLDRRNQSYVDATTRLAELALLLYVSDSVYRTGVTMATFMANKGETNPEVKVPIEKFRDYIFKEGATHGKNVIYENLGYSKGDLEYLANLYKEQALAKYKAGEYTLGKLDQYGQRINIEIELKGIGEYFNKVSYLNSGWMINADKSISLNTPFSGFTR